MFSILKRFLFFNLLIGTTLCIGSNWAFADISPRDHQKLIHKKVLPIELQKYLIEDEFSFTEGEPISELTAERLANFPPPRKLHTLPDPVNNLQIPTFPDQMDMVPDATDFRHAFGMPKMDYIVMVVTEDDLAYQEGRVGLGTHYAVRFNGNTGCVGGVDCDAPDFPWGSSNILQTDPNAPPNDCGNTDADGNPLIEYCEDAAVGNSYYCWDRDHNHCHARDFYTARIIKLDNPLCLGGGDGEGEDDDEDSPSLDCRHRDRCLSQPHRSLVGAGHKIGFLFTDSTPFRDDAQPVKYTSNNSGIQAGWFDVYWGFLPGQWVLLDDPNNPGHPIPSGKYIFQHAVNIEGDPPLDPCDPHATFTPLLQGEGSMRNNMLEMVINVPQEQGFHEDIEGTLWNWLLSIL